MANSVKFQTKINVIKKYNHKCVYCGFEGSIKNHLTVDHVVPRSLLKKEGLPPDSKENLVCACKKCNLRKSNKLLTEFIKEARIEVTRELAEFL